MSKPSHRLLSLGLLSLTLMPACRSNSAGPGSVAPPGVPSNSQGGAPSAATPRVLNRSGEVPTIVFGDSQLKLEVCSDHIVRVMVAKDEEFFARKTLATAVKRCDPGVTWGLVEQPGQTTLFTAKLQAVVDLKNGAVSFLDAQGEVILEEEGRALKPVTSQGDAAFSVTQRWKPTQTEALYGLGQHQQNMMNLKGYPLSLVQYNTQIVVPFLVSSRGYGILWDNTSWTRFGDLTDFKVLSEGGSYQGSFTADVSGDHFFQTWASGDIKLSIGGNPVISHWRQGWLPGRDTVRVPLKAGQTVALSLQFTPDIGVEIATLLHKPPNPDETTSLWSEVADGIDYSFVYGPEIDQVVGGYRQLTGDAPMMPKWAHGLWQCRERYRSAKEVNEVLDGFRSRKIPVDNIVMDWQYWVPGKWGSHDFDQTRFPNPKAWVEQVHKKNAQLMISVWPKFHAGTDSYAALDAAGLLYDINKRTGIKDFNDHPMSYYDAFNGKARTLFWDQMNNDLFSLGVDAWWMDGTEPEVVEGPYPSPEEHRKLYQTHMHPTALGSGSRMLNAYSLVNSQGVYEGQRAAAPNQRVFILTRSAFAGQQRYASASWSGDISTTWTAFKKQLPAGLNFVISGIPYWTTDIGGFAEHPGISAAREEWEELNTRWFQFGTFSPLLRVHGQDDRTGPREMWNFNQPAFDAHLKFDRLRYRLMPYIYSLAGETTQRRGTIMRPLVMDFRKDAKVYDIDDQYMFGPALLVNPVTDFKARSRSVYLPQTNGGWYNFWTGRAEGGGQSLNADAPYDALPLYVRAGSVIPIGPEQEYVDQNAADPLTLYVYAGADGQFTLYEDDGVSYGYEKGAFSEIDFSFKTATSTLGIAARRGTYPGMLQSRKFEVVLVQPAKGVGFNLDHAPPTLSVTYDGGAQDVVLL